MPPAAFISVSCRGGEIFAQRQAWLSGALTLAVWRLNQYCNYFSVWFDWLRG